MNDDTLTAAKRLETSGSLCPGDLARLREARQLLQSLLHSGGKTKADTEYRSIVACPLPTPEERICAAASEVAYLVERYSRVAR
jgi:hypothetical protein